ncbi:MAG: hypothetical protein GX913_01000 [Clostridiales bacterium]|nr:hypothetical protein [Clostridiales bacterium]
MQDRYTGDVGDFGKLGMLRKIADSGLRIGVNWYLTYKVEEHVNDDGKHIGYLNDVAFMNCDTELSEALRVIVRGERSVKALEKANLLAGATYYTEILKPGSERDFIRRNWYKESLEVLADADIIFCDPDNGLIVKSVSEKSKKGDKYILPEEIVSYFKSGKSVVFYNHRCREKESVYLERFQPLKQREELSFAEWKGLKFVRGTIRDYIFILQPHHVGRANSAIERLIKSNWNKHFSILDI